LQRKTLQHAGSLASALDTYRHTIQNTNFRSTCSKNASKLVIPYQGDDDTKKYLFTILFALFYVITLSVDFPGIKNGRYTES